MAWTEGLDEAVLGHAKLQGWAEDGNPEEIARAAVQAHLQTSKLVTQPGDYLRKPKDVNDTEAWNAVHAALGAAKDPAEYKFDEVKFKDGTPLNSGLSDALRAAAHKLRLSPDAAKTLAADVAAWRDAEKDQTLNDVRSSRTAEDLDLHRSWGGNYDNFKSNANRAAQLLGMSEAQVAAMESSLGYANAWNTLRGLADRLGESKVLDPAREGGGAPFKAMSREEAHAKREELSRDPLFVKRYNNVLEPGHKEAMDEMNHILRIIVGMPNR